MLKPILPILSVLLIMAACADPDRSGAPGNDASASPATAGEPSARAEEEPVCLQGDRYVADGAVPLSPPSGGDAQEVSALRWSRHEGCERFVIDLGTEAGDATTPGVVSVDVLRDLGVVRVSLREVEQVDTAATEARFDGSLARAAYTVRSPEEGRWLFVDLHLNAPAEVSAMVLDDPARVVLDLRPGGGSLPEPAAAGQRVVILEPRPGEASYPLTVAGYGRMFEANAEVMLEQGGRMVRDTFTMATDWAEAWGYYEVTIGDGPSGQVTLHAGEHSARDGTWEGVEVPLRMR